MKRKCLYGLLIFVTVMVFLMPLSIQALTVTPTLTCESKVSKSNTITCSVSVNVSGGTLSSFSANLSTDGTIITSSSNSVSATGTWTGNSKILTFNVSSTNKSGTGNVMLSNMVVTDSSGNTGTISGSTSTSKGIKVLNDESTLKDIKINYATLAGFSPVKKSYSITVNTSSVNVAATKNDSAATLTGTGTKKLTCGINKVSLNVKAEDGTSSIYTVNIKRVCNSDVTLKNLVLSSGTLTPVFSSAVKEYTAKVAKDVENITLKADKNNVNQTITGLVANRKLEYGENKFAIKVKAEDGTTGVYNLTITREDSRSNNANLSGIVLSDGKIDFNSDTTEYQTKVLNSVTRIDVVATPEDATSKVVVTGGDNLIVGDNVIAIKVISEKGEEKVYQITATRLKEGETLGDNANIKSITVTGYKLDFLSATTNYTLKIDKEKTLSIAVELEDATSKYEILGNSDLKNGSVITIKVTSLDGTVKNYKITIEKEGYMLYIIIAVISFTIALGLIIYLVVKDRKDKNNFDVTSEPIIEEPGQMEMPVETPIESVTTVNEEENKESALDENTVVEEPVDAKDIVEPIEEKVQVNEPSIDEKKVLTNLIYNKTLEDESTKEKSEEEMPSVASILAKASAPRDEEKIESTESEISDVNKKCSICGHDIPAGADKCPFCKVSL